jgi:hypothetical protein
MAEEAHRRYAEIMRDVELMIDDHSMLSLSTFRDELSDSKQLAVSKTTVCSHQSYGCLSPLRAPFLLASLLKLPLSIKTENGISRPGDSLLHPSTMFAKSSTRRSQWL